MDSSYLPYSCPYDIIVSQNSVDTLQIVSGKMDALIKNINKDEYSLINFWDINFDGYKDIQIYKGHFNDGITAAYNIWPYNLEVQKYEFSDSLTEKYGYNLEVDEKEKTITTNWTNGCGGLCYVSQVYKYLNGELILIEEESQDQNIEANGVFIYKHKKMINGVLTTVEETLK